MCNKQYVYVAYLIYTYTNNFIPSGDIAVKLNNKKPTQIGSHNNNQWQRKDAVGCISNIFINNICSYPRAAVADRRPYTNGPVDGIIIYCTGRYTIRYYYLNRGIIIRVTDGRRKDCHPCPYIIRRYILRFIRINKCSRIR